jgi:translocation protein SEC63
VVGERLITPSSIVYLIVKLRLLPPRDLSVPSEEDLEQVKRAIKMNEDKDVDFLISRKDAEDASEDYACWAHAPYWPGVSTNTTRPLL